MRLPCPPPLPPFPSSGRRGGRGRGASRGGGQVDPSRAIPSRAPPGPATAAPRGTHTRRGCSAASRPFGGRGGGERGDAASPRGCCCSQRQGRDRRTSPLKPVGHPLVPAWGQRRHGCGSGGGRGWRRGARAGLLGEL